MKGYILNPDKEYVEKIMQGIYRKDGHCPCRLNVDETTLCPCDEFIEKQICKCNIHVLESCTSISKLFDILKDKLDVSITLKTHAKWKIPQIDKNSTIGQQIKYYRRFANIKQTD